MKFWLNSDFIVFRGGSQHACGINCVTMTSFTKDVKKSLKILELAMRIVHEDLTEPRNQQNHHRKRQLHES